MNTFIPENSIWIMYSSEKCDPYFSKFVTDKTIVPAVSVLTPKTTHLIVHSLEYESLKDFNGHVTMYEGENALLKNMTEILKQLNFPKTIFLNFSDKMDSQIDVLGYGTFRFITDNILKFYKKNNKPFPEFESSDVFIYKLLDTKNSDDISYLKLAANRALQILNTAFKKIRPGMSEKHIVKLVQNIFNFKPLYFKKFGIIKEEFSWEKELCPIVLVGPNLKKGGHSSPGNEILRPGYTVYMDFGIKIHLKDGRKYSSDLQRMGYVRKHNERNIPIDVQNVFNTLYEAIDLGIKNSKPGVKGYVVDEIVRNYITKKGYPNYNHATGHPIGEHAHNPGTSISPKGHKRSELLLQENGVYTIEPRIQIENGGSIEEMVLVTKNGGIPLCKRQEKIYIIN